MGKEKKSNKIRWTPFDYMKGGRLEKMGERYGVDKSDYNVGFGRTDGGQGRTYKGGREEYEEAITKAAMSDYDTRRTIEAAALSGEKDAKKFAKKGFKNASSVYRAQEFFKKYRDSGGDFSSNEDYAGLTWKAVKADRDKFGSQFASIGDLQELQDKMTQESNNRVTEPQGPIEHSDRMSAANASVGNDHAIPKADTASEAAKLFADDYKFDVSKGARIAEERQLNLENAKMAMRR